MAESEAGWSIREGPSSTRISCMQQGIDYRTYVMSLPEILCYSLQAAGIAMMIGYVFYHSLIPALLILPFLKRYLQAQSLRLQVKRKDRLCLQFKDGIAMIAAQLSAGYAVENAIKKSAQEIAVIWGANADMTMEFERMSYQMSIGIPVERVWQEFAARSESEEVMNFAQIFGVVKRSGGELPVIISWAVRQITERLITEEQIKTQITAKRLEQKIMNLMPAAILMYVNLTSPEILEVMYQGVAGRLIMSVCLLIYGAAFMLSGQILRKVEV